jgi:trk system potassium uptake protein TrkA
MHLMQSDMNLSLTINPEFAAAKDIYRRLRFPAAARINTFCRGRVETAEFTVTKELSLCGCTLNELRNKLSIRFLVCSVLRNGEVHIPSGLFQLEEGDVICVTAPDEEIIKFFKAINAYKNPVKNVIIVGGGRITYYLESLMKKSKMSSTVIEPDIEKCEELASQFSCTVVCDTGTKQELLLEEGLADTDAFIALSSSDEENAIVSMYAKTKCNGKIITLTRSTEYADLFKSMGLNGTVSPKGTTVDSILSFVRSMANAGESSIESLHKFMDDKVEALEFVIKNDIDGITDTPLKALKLRSGVLIACIVHNDKAIIPGGNDMISTGDTVIVISNAGELKDFEDILR